MIQQLHVEVTMSDDQFSDPIIAILRLAYRRGLALRRELTKESETVDSDNLGGETLSTVERKNLTENEAQP